MACSCSVDGGERRSPRVPARMSGSTSLRPGMEGSSGRGLLHTTNGNPRNRQSACGWPGPSVFPRVRSRHDCARGGNTASTCHRAVATAPCRDPSREHDMADLSAFPIASRWPARHPDRIQLYSLNTPNGVKASIMLEETGLPYEAHLVDIMNGESHTPAYLSLNPNGKIPAIIDPHGPGGSAMPLFESGAILQYLADKSGQFIASEPAQYWQTMQWVHFQMASIGPMFGQLGFFNKFAGKDYEDKRPLQRYVAESKRLLGVLDARLD